MHDYLSNRKQQTKINLSYSNWHDIIFGVPHGSTLEHLLFNIFLINLLFIIKDFDFASYADDNTPYVGASDMDGGC